MTWFLLLQNKVVLNILGSEFWVLNMVEFGIFGITRNRKSGPYAGIIIKWASGPVLWQFFFVLPPNSSVSNPSSPLANDGEAMNGRYKYSNYFLHQ